MCKLFAEYIPTKTTFKMISEYYKHQSDLNESHDRQHVIEKIIYFTLGFIRAFNITSHVFNMVKISLFGKKHPFL